MSLYKGKYRIESTRLRNWNYASNGSYFITICTLNRLSYFGDIVNGKMILSEIGKTAYRCWQEIPSHFPFVLLDSFIIMPNHVHGIIVIKKSNDKTNNHMGLFAGSPVETHTLVETQDLASLAKKRIQPKNQTETKNKYGPQSRNIGSIIRGFKIGVTMQAKKNNIPFGWQSRFFDHIIRNYQDLRRIRKYIQNNPCAWKGDNFYVIK